MTSVVPSCWAVTRAVVVLGRELAVVVGVGGQGGVGVGDLGVHPGARTHGLGLGVVGGEGGRHDLDDGPALLQEREVGDAHLDGDGLVVLLLDAVEHGEEGDVQAALGGGALEGADHVVSGDIGAIGELGAVTQGDLVGVGVDLDGVAGGKAGDDGVVGEVDVVQALHDVHVGAQAERGGAVGRVIGRRGVGGADGQGATALLAARGGAGVGLGVGAAVAAASREAQSRGGRRATEDRATGNGVVRKVLHDCLYFSSCGRRALCPTSRP